MKKKVGVLRVEGKLVLGPESNWLRQSLEGMLGEYETVVVDIEGVTEIDPAGTGALVDAFARGAAAGTKIELYNHLSTVRKIPLVTWVKLRTVFDDVERRQ